MKVYVLKDTSSVFGTLVPSFFFYFLFLKSLLAWFGVYPIL